MPHVECVCGVCVCVCVCVCGLCVCGVCVCVWSVCVCVHDVPVQLFITMHISLQESNLCRND